MHDDELSTLLAAERPRLREGFAAELDARAAARFPPRPRAASPAAARRWAAWLHRPVLSAAATALAVGLVALVVALSAGDGPRSTLDRGGPPSTAGAFADQSARAARPDALRLRRPSFAAARKVERSASVELGTKPDRLDVVAQGVLGVVARYDGIVDQSSVQTGQDGGEASFQLRIPAAQLQPALAALSRLPDAHLLGRSDDTRDVNQTYVSTRRRLANARAERAGVIRALAHATTEDETLRLRARLDRLERTIASAERAQRALDRRVGYSRVSVAIHGGAGGGAVPAGDGSFGVGAAAHDAVRVLEVAAGVVVIAAAALLPAALLAALAWPLVRGVRRRRREHALDAV